jgi:uncharacterized protein HemX
MSDKRTPAGRPGDPANPPDSGEIQPPSTDEADPQGPNLKLLYAAVAIALAAAIGLALLIVLPFYQRR